mmetsp:Transcript_15899/g.60161  ORF Transcript_15899/g.60161 Transcript_15899/m.60161 type:complete len:213 (-) Transcript_15899:1079-1717(-)
MGQNPTGARSSQRLLTHRGLCSARAHRWRGRRCDHPAVTPSIPTRPRRSLRWASRGRAPPRRAQARAPRAQLPQALPRPLAAWQRWRAATPRRRPQVTTTCSKKGPPMRADIRTCFRWDPTMPPSTTPLCSGPASLSPRCQPTPPPPPPAAMTAMAAPPPRWTRLARRPSRRCARRPRQKSWLTCGRGRRRSSGSSTAPPASAASSTRNAVG